MAQAKKSKVKAQSKPKIKTKPPVKAKGKTKVAPKPKAAAKTQASPKVTASAKKNSASTKKSVKSAGVSAADPLASIRPLDDRLIVQIESPAEKTAGGLFIPATVSNERPNRGTVLAVGRGRSNKKGQIRPMDVKVGDEVLFASFTGTEMKIQGSDVVILREADLLGIVD